MKTLGFLISLITVICLCVVAIALGADPVAVVATPPVILPPVVVPPVVQASFLLWAQQNLTAILSVCLGIGELMSLSPWFKGNGIIDSLVKSLKFLIQKPTA